MSAAMGVALVGGAMQAGSQISAGNQANKIGQIQQQQFNENARLLDSSANAAEGAGINAASAAKRKNKFTQSRITALNAFNGGDSTDKNTAELLANTEAEGEYDALNNLYQGTSRATQIRNEAINQTNSGIMARYNGKSAQKASKINAITTLIGAGAKSSTFSNKYE